MKRVIEGGGFHNVPDLTIMTNSDPEYFGDGVFGIEVTKSQRRRIENHFCGISDCCCGSSPLVQIDYDRFVLPCENQDDDIDGTEGYDV